MDERDEFIREKSQRISALEQALSETLTRWFGVMEGSASDEAAYYRLRHVLTLDPEDERKRNEALQRYYSGEAQDATP